jgi:3-hydroxy-9,10-secoandrosta-1,3,5(10)-triene-9,17-dione monooxygenase reductase component
VNSFQSPAGVAAQALASEALDTTSFRNTVGAFATGVTVLTTAVDGELYGITANSFTSLSLDPMLVLVCLKDSSRALELFTRSQAFSVNVLALGQADLSCRFADRNRPTGAAAFDGVAISTGASGCPNILDCAAVLDCRVHQIYPGGDHVIVVGEVLAYGTRPELEPLVFHGGNYRPLGDRTADLLAGARGRGQLRVVPNLAR